MIELFFTPFFQRALIVGIILGALLAVLGVFVVVRRLSFFSDAIGHSALAGIALGLIWGISPFWVALIFTLIIAAVISLIKYRSKLYLDTLLGAFFPTAVAFGVILIQLLPGYQTDLMAYLFGDILTVQHSDILFSSILTVIIGVIVVAAGKRFIAIAFDEPLARVEGVPVAFYETLFLLLLAAVITLAIKLVGIVLVTAMLVIPAATAQNIASSMFTMFGTSIFVSLIAVMVGMLLSAILNVPSGPAIVIVSAGFFATSFLVKALRSNK